MTDTSSAPTASGAAPTASAGVDARDFGSLAWLRRASGDSRLRPWRLTPSHLGAYATGVRALMRSGPDVDLEDPGAFLDFDRQPLLRPWEYPSGDTSFTNLDPARALANLVAQRPALAAALRSEMSLEEFAATQLKLVVCARALVLLLGDEAASASPERVQAWIDTQRPADNAEEDFAASLLTSAQGRHEIEAAFSM